MKPSRILMSVIPAVLFCAAMLCFATEARADNTTGVYTVSSPTGNWNVVYSSFPNGMRQFTITKSGQTSTQYRVSATGPYWEMKIGGTTALTITAPNGPQDALFSPAGSQQNAFFWSEAEEDPSLYTGSGMSIVRTYLLRDKEIIQAMAVWVSDAEHVWAGVALGTHQTTARTSPLEISSSVITTPVGSVMYWSDTFSGCHAACWISFWSCQGMAMCILGCETKYHMKDVDFREACPGTLPAY